MAHCPHQKTRRRPSLYQTRRAIDKAGIQRRRQDLLQRRPHIHEMRSEIHAQADQAWAMSGLSYHASATIVEQRRRRHGGSLRCHQALPSIILLVKDLRQTLCHLPGRQSIQTKGRSNPTVRLVGKLAIPAGSTSLSTASQDPSMCVILSRALEKMTKSEMCRIRLRLSKRSVQSVQSVQNALSDRSVPRVYL